MNETDSTYHDTIFGGIRKSIIDLIGRKSGQITEHKLNPSSEVTVVFLDDEKDLMKVAKEIKDGHPVVIDYGATYGTAFNADIRESVAAARGERAPLAVVSLVCSREKALSWIDKSKIHPLFLEVIENGDLSILEGISFIRFPANSKAKDELGSNYVNADDEVQVFIVNDDPLMDVLENTYGIGCIAVRSSNITGQPEEPFFSGAARYASAIYARIIAVRSKNALKMQKDDEAHITDGVERLHRQRVGSQPIVDLIVDREGNPTIHLVRAGNTTPDTIKRLLEHVLNKGIKFSYDEEKQANHQRNMYDAPKQLSEPDEIRDAILKATLI